MKKLLLVFCVNICAFSSILVTIRNELGNAFFLKIFIPLVVISAFNLVAVLMVFSKAQKEKEDASKNGQKDREQKTEDGSLS